MKEPKNGQFNVDWAKVWAFVGQLRLHFRLLGVLFAVILLAYVVYYLITPPTFTAVAIVGPPGPSPTGMLMGALDNSSASGLSRKILGGGSTGGSSNYQDFLQILPSSRLAQTLIERDKLLPTLFPAAWDPVAKQWKPRGTLHAIAGAVKRQLNIPVSDYPNVDSMLQYLGSHLAITPTKSASASPLMSGSSTYMIVTFTFQDPHKAEQLLNVILSAADRIVRDDEERDVSARMTFLKSRLSAQDIANYERLTLTSVLSDQEQMQTMLQADQRFASTLVVPPYASLTPTSPGPITKALVYVVFFSLMSWVGLVYASSQFAFVESWLAWSKRKEASAAVEYS